MTDRISKLALILVFFLISACLTGSGPGSVDGSGAGQILTPSTGGTAGPATEPSVGPTDPVGMTGGPGSEGDGGGGSSGDPGTTEATPTVTGSPMPFTPEGCPEIYFERLEAAVVVSDRPSIPPRIEIKGHLMGYLERLPELPPSGIGGATVDFFESDEPYAKSFASPRTGTEGCFFASVDVEPGEQVELRAEWVCHKKARVLVNIPREMVPSGLSPCERFLIGSPPIFPIEFLPVQSRKGS